MTVYFLYMVLAFMAGMGLAVFYFGGLWLTVKQLVRSRQPALLIFISFIGRMGVILTGFYFVMNNHWERLIICLLGFLLVRRILMYRLRSDRITV